MKKEVTLYIHKCPECGWEAVRGEQQNVNFCSSCGYEGPPVVDTVIKEFDYPYITKTYEEDLERYRKSAEYLKRLEAGENPEDLDERLYEADTMLQMIESGLGFYGTVVQASIRRGSFYGGDLSFAERKARLKSGLERNEESY